MKYKLIAFFAFMLVVTMSIITSCNSSAKKVEEAKEDVVDAKDELKEAEEEYKMDMQNFKDENLRQIEANMVSINEFNARAEKKKKSAREAYKAKIADLEQQNTNLKMKLDGYQQEGKENWDAFKSEFKSDMDRLGEAFKDVTVKNN